MRCPQLDERPIWSDTTDLEDRALAKLLIARGRKSAPAAALVRTMVDAADYITVGFMLAPRVKLTVEALREAPVRERPKRTFYRTRKPARPAEEEDNAG